MYPQYLKFCRNNIHVIDKITQSVFKVSVDGDLYCLKGGQPHISETIEKFSTFPDIPSLSGVICVVFNNEDRIIAYLCSFVEGELLNRVAQSSESHKTKWKYQLTYALKSFMTEILCEAMQSQTTSSSIARTMVLCA